MSLDLQKVPFASALVHSDRSACSECIFPFAAHQYSGAKAPETGASSRRDMWAYPNCGETYSPSVIKSSKQEEREGKLFVFYSSNQICERSGQICG